MKEERCESGRGVIHTDTTISMCWRSDVYKRFFRTGSNGVYVTNLFCIC